MKKLNIITIIALLISLNCIISFCGFYFWLGGSMYRQDEEIIYILTLFKNKYPNKAIVKDEFEKILNCSCLIASSSIENLSYFHSDSLNYSAEETTMDTMLTTEYPITTFTTTMFSNDPQMETSDNIETTTSLIIETTQPITTPDPNTLSGLNFSHNNTLQAGNNYPEDDDNEMAIIPKTMTMVEDEIICQDGESKCPVNERCIQSGSICDGYNHCGNGADEIGCGICNNTGYLCRNGRCITEGYVCDGDNDCIDGSDEEGCHPCGVSEFLCRNGNCLSSSSLVCDMKNDCGDWSDELGCVRCGYYSYFDCLSNGDCLNRERVCDGVKDCSNGKDESHCGDCNENQFQCQNKYCISFSYVCDGDFDCEDHSDEVNC